MTKKKKYLLFIIIGIIASQILFASFFFYSIWNKFQLESPKTNPQLITEIEQKAEVFIINNYGLQKSDFKIEDVTYRSEFLDFSENRWRYTTKVKLYDARIHYFTLRFNGEKVVEDSNYLSAMRQSYIDEYMENLQAIEDYLNELGFYTRTIITDKPHTFIELKLSHGALYEAMTQKILTQESINFKEMLSEYPNEADVYIDLYMKEALPYSIQDIETELRDNFTLLDQNYHLRMTIVRIAEDGSMGTLGGYGKYYLLKLDE